MQQYTIEDAIAAYDKLKISKIDHFNPELVKIPFGTDGIEFLSFEKELRKNCNNIVRRLKNGVYFLNPVREIEIDKPDGGKRTLSIFTVRDNVAQSLVYEHIYQNFEKIFSRREINESSFAYRKGFSAQDAVLTVRKWLLNSYIYILDIDVSKFFDTVDYTILLSKIEKIYDINSPEYSFLKRFIRVGFIKSNQYLGIGHFYRSSFF